MTTTNYTKWLEALATKLKEIDKPDSEKDVIRPDTYEWQLTHIKHIGNIPKITFTPYGQDTPIKAEMGHTWISTFAHEIALIIKQTCKYTLFRN